MTRYKPSVEQRMARAAYTAVGWVMEPLLWLRHLCDEWEYRAIRRQRRRRSDAR